MLLQSNTALSSKVVLQHFQTQTVNLKFTPHVNSSSVCVAVLNTDCKATVSHLNGCRLFRVQFKTSCLRWARREYCNIKMPSLNLTRWEFETSRLLVRMNIDSRSITQDSSGIISSKQLRRLMRTLGHNPGDDELRELVNQVDMDENGKIDFNEFIILVGQ